MCRFYLSQTIFYYTNNLSEFLQESSLSAASGQHCAKIDQKFAYGKQKWYLIGNFYEMVLRKSTSSIA